MYLKIPPLSLQSLQHWPLLSPQPKILLSEDCSQIVRLSPVLSYHHSLYLLESDQNCKLQLSVVGISVRMEQVCSGAFPVRLPGPSDAQPCDFVGQDGVFMFAPSTHLLRSSLNSYNLLLFPTPVAERSNKMLEQSSVTSCFLSGHPKSYF